MIRARRVVLLALACVAPWACGGGPAPSTVPAPPAEPPGVQAPAAVAPIEESAPAVAGSPDPQLRRFDIVAAGESTLTILTGNKRWIRRGTVGFAVDPKRRDALVARFRVIGRTGDRATALVTGQTTRLDANLVALMREPIPGPLRQDVFWTGLFLGLAAGVAAALLVRR